MQKVSFNFKYMDSIDVGEFQVANLPGYLFRTKLTEVFLLILMVLK